MNSWSQHRVHPDGIGRIDDILRRWEPPHGCGGTLQAGDVGWKLRFGPVVTADSLMEWRSPFGRTGAITCRDSPIGWWFAIDPALTGDRNLALALAGWATGMKSGKAISIDGPGPPAVWRQVFTEHGFEATDDTWVHLWKPLSADDIVDVPGVESTAGNDRVIAGRVAVQRAAFANSTFTVNKWHAMAEGPSFRPEFDLLARDEAGEPVAAITVWLPGAGKCGMIEPMGTHPEHRRRGHGRRVILAACAALARAGASGVCVVTSESNTAALGGYRSAGFRRLGPFANMVSARS